VACRDSQLRKGVYTTSLICRGWPIEAMQNSTQITVIWSKS